MHRLVVERKMKVGQTGKGIRRSAGKRDHRHSDVTSDTRFVEYLLGFPTARHGDKHLIARGVAEENIAAIAWPGNKRRFAQHL